MHYFGVAKCPYCGKRVNLIRAWSLKKEGEYKCPRCSGISNIFLSPLVYVLAVLAIFSSIIVYFYHKVILAQMSLGILLPVGLPFVIFFALSIFMPYLKRPVIKKAPPKREAGRLHQQSGTIPTHQLGYTEEEDFIPKMDYQTGSAYLPPQGESQFQTKVLNGKLPASSVGKIADDLTKTAVVPSTGNHVSYPASPNSPAKNVHAQRPQTAKQGPAQNAGRPNPAGNARNPNPNPRQRPNSNSNVQNVGGQRPPASPQRPVQNTGTPNPASAVRNPNPRQRPNSNLNVQNGGSQRPPVVPKRPVQNENIQNASIPNTAGRTPPPVEAVEIPKDFFAKPKKD